MCVHVDVRVCVHTWAVAAAAEEGIASLDYNWASSRLGCSLTRHAMLALRPLLAMRSPLCLRQPSSPPHVAGAWGAPSHASRKGPISKDAFMWKKTIALGKALEATYPNAWGWNIPGKAEGQEKEDNHRELNLPQSLMFYNVQTRRQLYFATA